MFPETFPLTQVQDIIRMVRDRTVRSELRLFAESVWTIIGYCLGMLLRKEPLIGADVFAMEQLDEAFASMSTLQSGDGCLCDDPGAEAAGEEAIDPATIIMLVELALKIWQALKNRK